MLSTHSEGVDYPARVIERCRHQGISPWISLRMNDVHVNGNLDHPIHSDFWRNPELFRQGHPGYYARALDYVHSEVRDKYKALIVETLERYDLDGLELDFMREPYLFSKGKEQEGRLILTEWLRDIRTLVDAASKRRVLGSLFFVLRSGANWRSWILVRSGLLALVGLLLHATTIAEEPSTEDQESRNEIFRPEAGEFPPLEKAHTYWGELAFVDHVNRRGSIRIQTEGKFRFIGPSPFLPCPPSIPSGPTRRQKPLNKQIPINNHSVLSVTGKRW